MVRKKNSYFSRLFELEFLYLATQNILIARGESFFLTAATEARYCHSSPHTLGNEATIQWWDRERSMSAHHPRVNGHS